MELPIINSDIINSLWSSVWFQAWLKYSIIFQVVIFVGANEIAPIYARRILIFTLN